MEALTSQKQYLNTQSTDTENSLRPNELSSKNSGATVYKVVFVFAALFLAGSLALGGVGSYSYFVLKSGLVLKTWLMIGGTAASLTVSTILLTIGKKIKHIYEKEMSAAHNMDPQKIEPSKNRDILQPQETDKQINLSLSNQHNGFANEFINRHNAEKDSDIEDFNKLEQKQVKDLIENINERSDIYSLKPIINKLVNSESLYKIFLVPNIGDSLTQIIVQEIYAKATSGNYIQKILDEYPWENQNLKTEIINHFVEVYEDSSDDDDISDSEELKINNSNYYSDTDTDSSSSSSAWLSDSESDTESRE